MRPALSAHSIWGVELRGPVGIGLFFRYFRFSQSSSQASGVLEKGERRAGGIKMEYVITP